MARVKAATDVRTEGGLLIAEQGRLGIALLNYGKTRSQYGKVPVRWDGRKLKVYWVLTQDLDFIDPKLDRMAYVAKPPEHLLIYPPLPSPPGKFDYHFGRNLKQFRKERQIGQTQLSRMLAAEGIKAVQTTISWWERKRTPPRGPCINALAKILDIPAFLLLINFTDCTWLREVQRYVNKLIKNQCEEEPV
jgi:transcriptional regulator with XRE-family HTH domain